MEKEKNMIDNIKEMYIGSKRMMQHSRFLKLWYLRIRLRGKILKQAECIKKLIETKGVTVTTERTRSTIKADLKERLEKVQEYLKNIPEAPTRNPDEEKEDKERRQDEEECIEELKKLIENI